MQAPNQKHMGRVVLIVWLAALVLCSGANAAAKAETWINVTSYTVPTDLADPYEITLGPDGALWFTENGANQIGRIATAGVITEYRCRAPGPLPLASTAGPDGALWFAEGDVDNIGRITTAGVITEYLLPVDSHPSAITAGPDGALWFSVLNQIGRITTSGAITEYPLQPSGDEAHGITVGPDGAIWFTEFSGNRIGRITTSGIITEYPIGAKGPYGITAGPDGALWFVESEGGSYIGRAPACGVGLSASFANDTLTMNFSLGTSSSATWYVNVDRSAGGGKQLWSKQIPAVVPPNSFTIAFGPGFPDEGEVGIVSGLVMATGQVLCYETANANTAQ